MPECVKCGRQNEEDAAGCVDCTWPFTLHGWRTTTFPIHRVTLVTSCVNARQADADLNTLELWSSEGKISLERSDELLRELQGAGRIAKAAVLRPHPGVWTLGVSRLGTDTMIGGLDMSGPLSETLFPTTVRLSGNQLADVNHLRSLVLTGGDVFVTRNTRDFIRWGKQEVLAKLGIWVLSPSGIVALLRDVYGWS